MKKTENQDPVNEALQHAGEPTVVTPELLALDQERVTSESEIPEEEFLFRLNGVPCCPRGDLSTMTGPAKTGKTSVAAMLMAHWTAISTAALSWRCVPTIKSWLSI